VCDDFGLATRIEELIDGSGVAAVRLPGWKAWKHEIFADFHGTLAGGPAFVGALIDFLAQDPETVSTDRRVAGRWGFYPPDYLRVQLNLEFLRQSKPAFSVDALAAEWNGSFSTHAMDEFSADLELLARAFHNGTFPQLSNCTLPQILCFSSEQQDKVTKCADDALSGFGVNEEDVRVLFAAARTAFVSDPVKYQSLNITKQILEKVPRTTTVRAENLRQDPARLQAFLDSDRQAGADLLAKLRAAQTKGTVISMQEH
jgi:hypothetical protein